MLSGGQELRRANLSNIDRLLEEATTIVKQVW
jgi:hypothetical protein